MPREWGDTGPKEEAADAQTAGCLRGTQLYLPPAEPPSPPQDPLRKITLNFLKIHKTPQNFLLGAFGAENSLNYFGFAEIRLNYLGLGTPPSPP